MAHTDNRRTNTYLWDLGAQREIKPPVGWDDQPAQLGINPNILNDPAFSEYDLSNIRTFEQDPRLRDIKTLGDKEEIDKRLYRQSRTAGFTYVPGMTPYDPNKVYVKGLDDLKMAVGPGVEQTKQGAINKELASTISHEFRHNLFDQPEYSGIIDAAYNRFGGFEGNISRHELEEYINRAADVQLMPESWLQGTLDNYQDEYNEMLTDPESWIRNEERMGRHVPRWKKSELLARKMPAHLTPMNTTKKFHRAATNFFNKVRREKLKRPTQRNIQKRNIGMPEHLTTYTPPKRPYVTPPRGGGADVMPTPPPKQTYVSPAPRPHGNGGGQRGSNRGGFSDPGKDSYGPWKAHGGLIDIPLPGRRRDI